MLVLVWFNDSVTLKIDRRQVDFVIELLSCFRDRHVGQAECACLTVFLQVDKIDSREVIEQSVMLSASSPLDVRSWVDSILLLAHGASQAAELDDELLKIVVA